MGRLKLSSRASQHMSVMYCICYVLHLQFSIFC